MATLTRAVYKSRSKGLRVPIRKELKKHHPVTGDVIEQTPPIYAEFGVFGPEQPFYNQLEGAMDTTAVIIGGYFDLDAVAEDQRWDDDLIGLAERTLDRECAKRPDLLWRITHITLPAEAPWPTYDETAVDEIAALAEQLGLSGKAAAYEREHLERAELLARLDADAALQPEPVAAPVAVAVDPPAPAEASLLAIRL